MTMVMILAVSENGVIGKDNGLPWKLANDMKRFKELTTGKRVVMGRKTWESLPDRFRPLPDRENVVITRDVNYDAPGAIKDHSNVNLICGCEVNKIYTCIIGGEQIYRLFLPFCDVIEMTLVRGEVEGDAYFKDFLNPNWNIGWEMTNRRDFSADEKHSHPYSFLTWKRITGGVLK